MQRTSLTVLATLLVLTASTGGVAGASFADGVDPDNGLGLLAQDTSDGLFSNLPDEVATYDGTPGWHVAVSDKAALEDWADASEEREILRFSDSRNTAVIRASPSDIGTGYLDRLRDNGLHARSYVDAIAVVQTVSTPEPPEPVSREDFEPPGQGISVLGVDVPFFGGPSYAVEGIAFEEDANKKTIGEVRQIVGAENVETGSGVRVAVLDNTWTYDQDLYQQRIGGAYDFVDDERALANNSYQNVSHAGNHGDWTMSAVGADAANDSYDGIAPDAELYFGRVLGESGGNTADIVAGLEWACKDQNVDVVSLSLGSPMYSAALDDAVTNCADQGTVVVIAAGNSAGTQPVGLGSPADTVGTDPQEDGIITVAATNASNASTAGVAHFSQRGPDPGAASSDITATRGAEPTVAAPGMQVEVMTADGKLTLSGTSMSTPIVAGAAAVIRDTWPTTTSLDRIEQRIAQGAEPIPHAGTHEVGAGMLDVMGALNTEPGEDADYYSDQIESRTTAAETRDAAYETLSADIEGRFDSFWRSIGA